MKTLREQIEDVIAEARSSDYRLDLLVQFVEAQSDSARAAGYAEAVEKAAKVAKAEYDRLYRSHRDADLPGMNAARAIEDAIRALATTKEPK